MLVAAYRMYQGNFIAPQRAEISYTQFIREVDGGNIENLQITENTVTGDLKHESIARTGGPAGATRSSLR